MTQRELFTVQKLPVFQNKMFATQEAAIYCTKGDMRLVQDEHTGLIFNTAFDASLLVYDVDYQNEQAVSGLFREHLYQVKLLIDQHFKNYSLIEVGCGKAYFLDCLTKAGYQITGIDPAYEGQNPNIIKAPFTQQLGLQAEGLILRHVLEHITNPIMFLENLANANGNQGKIYIEVPCFDWILEHNAWFDIFYEHVNYFRLADFQRLFDKVYDSGRLFGGQYLYVIADLASLKIPVCQPNDFINFPKDFLKDITRFSKLAQQRPSLIWGGASKGVIFALYLQRAGITINAIVDINPAKQYKYIAATGLRVLPPEQALTQLQKGDNIFVMNSNYLSEIITQSNNQYTYLQVDQHEF